MNLHGVWEYVNLLFYLYTYDVHAFFLAAMFQPTTGMTQGFGHRSLDSRANFEGTCTRNLKKPMLFIQFSKVSCRCFL